MQIKTFHTLTFTMAADSADQQTAAITVLRRAAKLFGCEVTTSVMPMPENAPPELRNTSVVFTTDGDVAAAELDVLFKRTADALTLLGLEVA